MVHIPRQDFELKRLMDLLVFIKIQNEMKERYERDLRDMEYNHSRLVGRLEANASSLESQVRDLTEKCCRLDSTVHELRNRVSSGENEARLAHEELQELRKENLKLESLKGDVERSSAHLGNRVSILEQELRSKEVQLLQIEGLLQSAQDQKVYNMFLLLVVPLNATAMFICLIG